MLWKSKITCHCVKRPKCDPHNNSHSNAEEKETNPYQSLRVAAANITLKATSLRCFAVLLDFQLSNNEHLHVSVYIHTYTVCVCVSVYDVCIYLYINRLCGIVV